MNQIVKWNGGQIIVRPGLVEDELAASIIKREVSNAYPDGTWGAWPQFADLCSQTVSSSGLDFQPELVRNMDPAQKRDAYERYLKLAKSIRDKWSEAFGVVNRAIDVDLGPESLPETATKKA